MRTLLTRARDSIILQMIRDAAPGVIFAVLLVLAYLVVGLIDTASDLKEKESLRSILICPPKVDGLVFTHSGFTKLNLARPGSVSLNCYYSRRKE